jgi:DNA-binding transcriptional LysR family regulator
MAKGNGASPRINLRQLDAFRATVLAGTVSAAATRLAISQPAVSRLIADLERSIGFALFERRKRRLQIRPEGEMLYQEVEKSFIGVEKIARCAEEIRDYRSGNLRIACMPAVSLGFLTAAICSFRAVYPNVTVSLQIRSSQKIAEWMASQQFDIALAAMPISQAGVVVEEIDPIPCVCVLPKRHPLARKHVIGPAMLANENFIAFGADSLLRYRIDQAFAAAGIAPHYQLETTMSASALLFVASGLGISIVDPFTPLAFPDAEVAIRPFLPAVPYEFAMVFSPHAARSRVAEAFTDIFRRQLADFRRRKGGESRRASA